MASHTPVPPLDAEDQAYRVTTLELFFDLVFVFALTQLTGVFTHHLNPAGLAQIVIMFGVLWWMYAGYAWLTNTLAPTTPGRRLLVLVGMGGFFMVALATPTGFGRGGIFWGVGYLVLVSAHAALYSRENPQIFKVLPANVLAGGLIVTAGVLADGPAVWVLWTLALVVPIVQPYLVPAGGRFRLRPAHIVERHGLLVMITLGESIAAMGAGAAALELDAGLVLAVLLGLALAAALWWTYFGGDDERAEEKLTEAGEVHRVQLTMYGYFYAHIPLLVGVLVLAAGLKKAVGHAADHLHTGPALALGGGLALYLAGDALFRRIIGIGPSKIRLGAAVASLAAVPAGLWAAGAELALLTAVLVIALLAEHRAGREHAEQPATIEP
ncbi:low temperature requirement protein A [Actinomadura rayongensis]|uniref:Low temperature requirement protein A n=1 Tax=Actinomadura rayongensis TaxID=1429076 RepID=A0A6I4WAJ6_9ACTN|nr:low temperature requirement protein A [Actinomadura rayongensis]MXQ65096.1 low temperature requirement protein A [Actinomadura rayongensis]